MLQLNLAVDKLLAEYTGGVIFFDNLDAYVRTNKTIGETLLEMVGNNNIIMSGKFGRAYINSQYKFPKMVVVVNGGLRTGIPIDDLGFVSGLLAGEKFYFIDDSLYSGRTRDAVRCELQKHGAELIGSIVAYDGAKIQDPLVKSLYRYYDYH